MAVVLNRPTANVVQFHTPESFECKMGMHLLYDEFRTTLDPVKKAALQRQINALVMAVPEPPGVLTLPTTVSRPLASDVAFFAELIVARSMKAAPKAEAAVRAACRAAGQPRCARSVSQTVETAALVVAQLATPSSPGGNHWLWATVHTLEEPLSHRACFQ